MAIQERLAGTYNVTNIPAGLATTTVLGRPGVLGSITINTKGATANTLTVYDSLTGAGNKIATIDTTTQVVTLNYNSFVNTGITLVSATGTGADITVTFI